MKDSDFLKRVQSANSLDIELWPRKPGVYRIRVKLPPSIDHDEEDIILTSPDDLTKEEAIAIHNLVFNGDWSETIRTRTKDK